METIDKMTNIAQITTSSALTMLINYFIGQIQAGIPCGKITAPILWGPPGLGKSDIVRELAEELGKRLDKKVVLKVIQLSMYTPQDLAGMPTYDKTRTKSVFLTPAILDVPDDDDTICVFFFDEMGQCPPAVANVAFRIVLDRTIGEHRLPKNSLVICASNRISDKSGVNRLPLALMNRMLHVDIRPDAAEWIRWAGPAGIDMRILGFISQRPDLLYTFDPKQLDMVAFASPRSWEFVSRILAGFADITSARELIAGAVGSDVAAQFIHWSQINKDLPTVEDIFAGKAKKLKNKSPDVEAFIESAMVGYAARHKDDRKMIANALAYVDENFRPEYTVLVMQDFEALDAGYRAVLMRMPVYQKLTKKVAGVLK